jgi:membrane protease subunit HflK
MAWNQPDNGQGGNARRGGSSFEETLRRWQQRLGGTGSGGAPVALYIAIGLVLLWLGSGLYQIDAPERGVVQRFGRYIGVSDPGMGWRWPWPIETVSKVNVSSVNSIDYQSRMLTADLNLVNISCAIQYQFADPLKVLFQVRDPEGTLREVSESAIREIIGQNPLNSVLAGEPRQKITTNTRDLIQKTLDGYNAGIRVLSVNLTEVQVPEPVLPSQRDFNKAKEDRERFSQEARAYANDLLPRAQGTAQRQLLDAQAYRQQVVAAADGDASRFNQLAAAYAQAPDVTRNRMYIETMEAVMSRSRKVLLDTKSGGNNVLYLPLDKLLESQAGRSTAAAGAAPAGTVQAESVITEPSTDPRSRERGER